MLIAGLDLAAKETNLSGLAILKSSQGKPKLISLRNVKSDKEILDTLKKVNFLAIDAPLIQGNLPKGYREAERQLINLGLRLMTPSFLKGLVKRAKTLVSQLPAAVKVVEVHPRSSALLLGLNTQRPVFNQPRLRQLIDSNNMACANKHQFDALVAAYTAYLQHQKLARIVGHDGSRIAIPHSRNIKLVVFDMDGTITRPTSSWEHIHRQLGTWESKGEVFLKQFLASEITYEEFARLDTAQWQGIAYEVIKKIADSVPYVKGAAELMKFLASKRIKTVVISGGLSVIAQKIAEDFGIKRIFVNDLVVKKGIVTGDIKINVTFNGKLPIFRKLLRELKLKPYQVMTIGDTHGDVPLFQNSGLSVAINPIRPEVADIADYEVKSLAEVIALIR